MLLNCDIQLDSSIIGCVYPEQHVSGAVVLNIFEDYVIKALNIKLLGYVTGALRSSGGIKEYFLKLKITIIDQPIILVCGSKIYNFKFNLPDNVPPTINAESRRIRYKIRVTLERPWDQDKIYETRLKVGTNTNLNQFCPLLSVPVMRIHNIKYFNLFNRKNTVNIKFHLPGRRYVVDDIMPISVEVNNKSVTNVYLKFELEENITFFGKHLETQELSISTIKCTRVKAYSELIRKLTEYNFIQSLRVPKVVTTTIIPNTINVGYKLLITLLGKGLHLDNIFKISVVIVNRK